MKLNYAKNDVLIDAFLALDGIVYDVRKDGTIWTKLYKNGKFNENNEWRRLDHFRKDGYSEVRYKRSHLATHRIIYRKFNGGLDPNLEVNHKNDNPADNLPGNLELMTPLDNIRHSFRAGRKEKRAKNEGNKKITLEIANNIRQDHASGMTYKELSEKYGLCKSTISYIINNKTWVKI
jgi:hypothetical protein